MVFYTDKKVKNRKNRLKYYKLSGPMVIIYKIHFKIFIVFLST